MSRAVLGCTLLLLCGTLAAEDKKADAIDANKLVGKWTPKVKEERDFTIEFKKDGKAVFNVFQLKQSFDATYRLEGAKLSVSVKGFGAGQTSHTITKLTDAELILENGPGVETALIRIKDK